MSPIRKCVFIWLIFAWSISGAANTLVVVSLDGFRWNYLDKPEAVTLKALAEQGVRVTRLKTVYPSKTFPAHLSLATGLPPTGHGIVDNYFCRSDRPDCYIMGSGAKDSSWMAGTPLWTLVEQQGGKAFTFFWPESDATFAGVKPSEFRLYDSRVPYSDRVQQVIRWLEGSPLARPDLVTLYFSSVDSAGHTYGPDAPETAAAIANVDLWVGKLWDGIQRINNLDTGALISLLIVSDHGMAKVDPNYYIDTNELPYPLGFKRVNGGSRVMYYRRNLDADLEALRIALDRQANGRFWVLDKQTLAERGYVDHPAVADLIIETEPPRMFRQRDRQRTDLLGMHGYPGEIEEMAGIMVAVGPAFQSSVVIDEAHQLDVYPMAVRILGLTSPIGVRTNDGPLSAARFLSED